MLTCSEKLAWSFVQDRVAVCRHELVEREVEVFEGHYPPLPREGALPVIDWGEVRRQLEELSEPAFKPMVNDVVSALIKQADQKPPELLIRELICIAWLALDGAREDTFV